MKVSGKKSDIRPLLCDNCSHNADIEQEKFAHASNVHDFPVTSTIKAELGRIFFTMFDAVKEIVKADAEACAIQHTGMLLWEGVTPPSYTTRPIFSKSNIISFRQRKVQLSHSRSAHQILK